MGCEWCLCVNVRGIYVVSVCGGVVCGEGFVWCLHVCVLCGVCNVVCVM